MGTGNPLFKKINLTTVQKLTRHDVFTSFWGIGDGGAVPMQVEIVEDEACDPTDEFITKSEKEGTRWEF